MTDAPPILAAPPRQSAVRRALGTSLWLLAKGWPFLALIGLFVLYLGWRRSDAGGAAGDRLGGTVSPAAAARVTPGGRLRVGVYNIQGAVGKADPAVLARVADTVAAVDLCGLAEVRGNAFDADARDQARMLGERLGCAWLFAPSERRFWRDFGGNGVLARLPVDRWTRLPLPATGEAGSYRNVVLLRARAGGRLVNVLVTHLDRGPSRAAQLAAVATLFAAVEAPAVLLADLNTVAGDPLLAPVLAAPGAVDAIGSRAGPDAERVDWIVARGLAVRDGGRVQDAASDHAFFWAELEPAP